MSKKTAPTINNWRRIVAQNVRRMSPEQAKAALHRINVEGVTIFHETVREITNGLNSQSINHYVIQKLARRAGVIKW